MLQRVVLLDRQSIRYISCFESNMTKKIKHDGNTYLLLYNIIISFSEKIKLVVVNNFRFSNRVHKYAFVFCLFGTQN